METDSQADSPEAPKWKPIPRLHRRVLGVLVEKAKTTPNGYPLSLNGVVTGSKQKSNRSPQMDVTPEDAEDALEELRGWGATGEVHGDGRVVKYRHYMKDWLGVDGTELAVMAELLLRGAQTIGELRGRAARMAGTALPDVGSLKPVVDSLIEKGLVISLTPAGRGQVVTHTLFQEQEMDKVKAEHSGGGSETPSTTPRESAAASAKTSSDHAPSSPAATTPSGNAGDADLRQEVAELRNEVARLRKEVEDIWENIG